VPFSKSAKESRFLAGKIAPNCVRLVLDGTLRFAERIWFVADSSIHLRNRGVVAPCGPPPF
jgi:hypothetical protein